MAYPSTAGEPHRFEQPDNAQSLAADTDERPPRPPHLRPGSGWQWVALVVIALAVIAAFAYYLWQRQALPPAAPAGTQAPETPPSAATTPPIEHPIENAQAVAPPSVTEKPLPALMVSDTTMQQVLADLFGQGALGSVFYDDSIVHRFVTTVDNLPRKTLPLRYSPVKPVVGTFAVAGKDNEVTTAPDNAARYTPYVQMLDAVDAKKMVGVYVHFYPLLQQDYRALGYPQGYFNDRMVQTIDDLLAAPDAPASAALVQPKVLYQYADADLESRSAGQKIMMRMGSDNEAKVKAKLREIRALLTGSAAKELKSK